MELSRRWESEPATESFRLTGIYGSDGLLILLEELAAPPESDAARQSQLDTWQSVTTWLDLAETIGVIYVDKGINGRVIFNMWGASFALGWDIWKDVIDRERERTGLPGAYRNFQLLALEMKDRLNLEAQPRLIRLLPAAPYLRWRKLIRAIKGH